MQIILAKENLLKQFLFTYYTCIIYLRYIFSLYTVMHAITHISLLLPEPWTKWREKCFLELLKEKL